MTKLFLALLGSSLLAIGVSAMSLPLSYRVLNRQADIAMQDKCSDMLAFAAQARSLPAPAKVSVNEERNSLEVCADEQLATDFQVIAASLDQVQHNSFYTVRMNGKKFGMTGVDGKEARMTNLAPAISPSGVVVNEVQVGETLDLRRDLTGTIHYRLSVCQVTDWSGNLPDVSKTVFAGTVLGDRVVVPSSVEGIPNILPSMKPDGAAPLMSIERFSWAAEPLHDGSQRRF